MYRRMTVEQLEELIVKIKLEKALKEAEKGKTSQNVEIQPSSDSG